jgi:hypothetical protein
MVMVYIVLYINDLGQYVSSRYDNLKSAEETYNWLITHGHKFVDMVIKDKEGNYVKH